jgi:type II secretory pathway component GspD/PulD (secretin)
VKRSFKYILLFLFVFFSFTEEQKLYTIDFEKIEVTELVKFVSKITKKNFISHDDCLNFTTSFNIGAPLSKSQVLKVTLNLLEKHDLEVVQDGDLYFIKSAVEKKEIKESRVVIKKLEYHKGSEILSALQKLTTSLDSKESALKESLESMQWLDSSNSLMYRASRSIEKQINALIERLDTPLKQVFIEILVIETSLQKGLEFGLDWTIKKGNKSLFNIDSSSIKKGFELGIIGDLIKHGNNTFTSISALVSALGQDANNSIVLNQKIITQENKCSHIFVGDNIPFASSTTETQGSLNQKTSNVDYKDIGVCLNITPSLGKNGIITLDISEEITEATEHFGLNSQQTTGIKTSKTDMKTQAHIPDQHFFILSGMTRTKKHTHTSGIPCLGSIPFVGSLFSKKITTDEKRSVLVFVKPQIIQTKSEYQALSEKLYD